jgi:hypothetical protein
METQKEHAFVKGAHVVETLTRIRGVVLDRLWVIDTSTSAPAKLAYMVRFRDGRIIRRLETELHPA